MLASGHEAILKGSKIEGVGHRRPRSSDQRRSREDLLGFGADPSSAGSSSAPTDRRRGAQADPRGRPRLKGAALEEWLPAQLRAQLPVNNDLTLEEEEHTARPSKRPLKSRKGRVGLSVHGGRAIARLPGGGGWPIKKRSQR